MGKKLYRYGKFMKYVDGYTPYVKAVLYLEEFAVIRETECYYYIMLDGKKKRVSKEGKKIFARDTKEKALDDVVARGRMALSYTERNTQYIESAIKEAQKLKRELV